MAELWDNKTREEFMSSIKNIGEKIKVPSFSSIRKQVEKSDIGIPDSYEDGMDIAIEVLAKIQRHRDILIALKTAMMDKKGRLNRLWHVSKNSFLIRDSGINDISTIAKKEAAIGLIFENIYSKRESAETNVECLTDLVESVISKFNTCSRQIALMEMQIRLGEVDRKKKKTWG